jgi:hypothetical protein
VTPVHADEGDGAIAGGGRHLAGCHRKFAMTGANLYLLNDDHSKDCLSYILEVLT